MKDYIDILTKDIEIPCIVNEKMEDAFAEIRMEENMNNDNKRKKFKFLQYPAAAIACICMLVLGGTTVYAAYKYFWSPGMQGTLQSTEAQQQTLVNEGVATVFRDEENYENMAVTDAGITVTPETIVVNDKMVYLSLSVEGYSLAEGAEPCFEFVDVYLGDDPNAEDGWLNMGASFYDGIIASEDGTPMYDDGTPLALDENGRLISYYTDENGKMEFIIVAMVCDEEDSLLGKTLHVDLTNLGTVSKASFEEDIEGEWNHTFKLSDVSSMELVNIGKEIENTMFTIDTMEISPVSVKINYTVNGQVKIHEDDLDIPEFSGVVLEDGTSLPYLSDGAMSGFTDKSLSKAYTISAFDRVIDTEQVVAISFKTKNGIQIVEIR